MRKLEFFFIIKTNQTNKNKNKTKTHIYITIWCLSIRTHPLLVPCNSILLREP